MVRVLFSSRNCTMARTLGRSGQDRRRSAEHCDMKQGLFGRIFISGCRDVARTLSGRSCLMGAPTVIRQLGHNVCVAPLNIKYDDNDPNSLTSCTPNALQLSDNPMFEQSSRSCLVRAPTAKRLRIHNMPRCAARKGIIFPMYKVACQAVCLMFFNFPIILCSNGRQSYA